ncbi:SDR family oxidoreductase [Paenibacillus sp. OV219]|uniref:SDR family oxidoreductase n=1 Tax=Paenibacillus sp. OV219 TaxID=1884377 RepID=UPI0008CFB184|nr:SDR family oxidoreductase [Paenibacillus sp. OV219]SEN96583.1 NAD(P)-dependent dehydrogenase, short-chain alcohol dehydrogenase family [Paenibacillus sp. OV219]
MKRYAFVTGADHGLGFALVKELLNRQYCVIAGRYMADNQQLTDLAELWQDQLSLVELDVASDRSVADAAAQIARITDTLELVINNAGILGDIQATILDPLPFADIQHVYNVNTLGPLRVTNAVAPLVLRGESKLFVQISSEAGSIGDCERNSWFGYCMSKTAVNMQGALIHNEVKKSGGKVLLLHPGWVQSYMSGSLNTEATLTADESAAHLIDRIQEEIPAAPEEKPKYLDYEGNKLPW